MTVAHGDSCVCVCGQQKENKEKRKLHEDANHNKHAQIQSIWF